MQTFLSAFTDELVKTATRAGLKMIRKLVESGNISKADALARAPGVLKAVERRDRRIGGQLIHSGRSPGSQIKPLGVGQEHASTLVADPQYGVWTRKIETRSGVVDPAQMDLKRDLSRKMGDNDFSPKHLEDWRGDAGHRMSGWEYVHGVPAAKADKAGQQRAAAALEKYRKGADKAGYNAADLHGGNVIVTKDGAKVVDSIVEDRARPGYGGVRSAPRAPLSHGEHMRRALNPSTEEMNRYDRSLEPAKAKARALAKKRGISLDDDDE